MALIRVEGSEGSSGELTGTPLGIKFYRRTGLGILLPWISLPPNSLVSAQKGSGGTLCPFSVNLSRSTKYRCYRHGALHGALRAVLQNE